MYLLIYVKTNRKVGDVLLAHIPCTRILLAGDRFLRRAIIFNGGRYVCTVWAEPGIKMITRMPSESIIQSN